MTAAGATATSRVAVVPANVLVAVACLGLVLAHAVAVAAYVQLVPDAAGLPGSGPEVAQLLTALGWDPAVYVGIRVCAELVWVVTSLVAALLVLRGAASAFPRWVAFVLVFVATGSGTAPATYAVLIPGAAGVFDAVVVVAYVAFFTLAYLFPDGRLVPRWAIVGVIGWLALVPLFTLAWPLLSSSWIANVGVSVAAVALLGSAIAAQVVRYRRFADTEQRSRTRLVLVALVLLLVDVLVVVIRPPATIDPGAGAIDLGIDLVLTLTASLTFSFLAVAVTAAVVRHRLFDIDVVVRRVVVWALLTGFVVAAYVAVVVGVGSLIGAAADGLLSLLATALVAVTILPVHHLVRRGVDRWVYGRRAEPAVVARILGSAGVASSDPDVLARDLADALTRELRLRSAEFLPADAPAIPEAVDVRLDYEGVGLAVLRVIPDDGDRLRARDRRLLEDLAPQLAAALQAARSTREVRASRERLVLEREDERRRLHRDLHDGLGPTLASLIQRLEVAERSTATSPERAASLIAGGRAELSRTLDDVRALVHDLRPPALDELGLDGALRALGGDGTPLHVTADGLGRLPAAVEVAAYRIAAEAVANALRHGRPDRCDVALTRDGGTLVVTVDDDGTGIPEGAPPGTGLASMRSRAEEIGGELTVVSGPTGTTIRAALPIGGAR